MLKSQSIGVEYVGTKSRLLGARLRPVSVVIAVALPACAVSAQDQPAVDEAMTASSALSPTIHWSATAAGGTVAFSADGTRVVTGAGGAEEAKLRSAANGALVQTFAVEGAPDTASFSKNGAFLAVGSAGFNPNLSVFNLTTGQRLFQKVGHANGTTSVRFLPNNPNQFVSAGRDKMTKVWNVDGTVVRTMSDGIRVLAMDVSPDGTTAASNASGTIHIWRISDGTRLLSFTATNKSAVAYSPDGTIISTGNQLFNAVTGALIRDLAWPSTSSVVATTFTKNGQAVVSGGDDVINGVDTPTIRYFRVSDGAIITTFDHLGTGSIAYVNSVAISPDGTSLAYSLAHDNVTALATSPF